MISLMCAGIKWELPGKSSYAQDLTQYGTFWELGIMNVTTFDHEPSGSTCHKVSQVMARVGKKWSMLIILYLDGGPHRFTEIKRSVTGISQRMLTLCLRGLERDGLIKRTVHAVMPPHVEYELTPLGRSLTGPVKALGTWANKHLMDIDAARIAFDQRQEPSTDLR